MDVGWTRGMDKLQNSRNGGNEMTFTVERGHFQTVFCEVCVL